MQKLILIDGNSLVNRAFYAVPPLTNQKGFQTNGIFGFLNMLNRVLKEEKPQYLVVAFDAGKTVFRHEMYENYKGSRKETPEPLKLQFPVLKEVLAAMGIPQLEKPGFEADDLIGTLACKGSQAGLEVLIITGDRDSFQLIDANTTVLFTKRGITELERFDEAHLYEVYQLKPSQIIDLKGLMGDASDDIPGIPGIGEKTALKLLAEHKSLEGVLAAHDQYAGKKLGEKLVEFAQQAHLSKSLATIDCQVPLEQDIKDFVPGKGNPAEKIRLYKELEFKSMLEAALKEEAVMETVSGLEAGDAAPAALAAAVPAKEISDWAALVTYMQGLKENYLFILPQGLPLGYGRYQWQMLGLKVPGQPAVYIDFTSLSRMQSCLEVLKPYFEDEKLTKVAVDAKAAYMYLTSAGIAPQGVFHDLVLMGYLLDPAKPYHWLTGLEGLEKLDAVKQAKAAAKQGKEAWDGQVMGGWVEAMASLYKELPGRLQELNMWTLYEQAERPLALILGQMEQQGMQICPEVLEEMGEDLAGKIAKTSDRIFQLAGLTFNLNSPKQMGEVLFDKMGLTKGKKTKTGYSTDADTLEYLAQEHEIARYILDYRQYSKLKSTYIDGLLAIMNPATHKIHTSLNQTIAVTGRLSSTEPNLQNIPVRLEEGRQIRKAFVASPGCLLLSGDYSQIELRILAHLSGDELLQQAFINGQDIHRRTASEVFGIPMEAVSSAQRRAAKAVNFGLIYGISDFGLSQDLGISRAEAKRYMEMYFLRYPKVKAYLDQIPAMAAEQGYVETLMHRRRYLPELASRNFHLRSFGQRAAMNAPIQGTAADIMKLAMVKVQEVLAAHGLSGTMVLQVHDELIFDLPADKIDSIREPIRKAMQEVCVLSVPLLVDMKCGPDWYHMEQC